MPDEVFLVTGASGCIGAWVLRRLHEEGIPFVAVDLSDDRRRLGMVLDEDPTGSGVFITADISVPGALNEMVQEHKVTHIVHLAALQIPACAANPTLGAQVNVGGTINVFETIRRMEGRVQGFCYASSVAAFNGGTDRRKGTTGPSESIPTTLYGNFKRAVESIATVYASDHGIGSVGLRPCVVYGPGRDQGLTSDVSQAMLAAAGGVRATVRFSGQTTLQYAGDVASITIAATRACGGQALCLDVGGSAVTMTEVVNVIEEIVPSSAGTISVTGSPLPFPSVYDPAPLDSLIGRVEYTSLRLGVESSIERFKALIERGALVPPTRH